MNSVLVTNGLLRMALAAVRSLGKKKVEVIAAEKTRVAPSLLSRYCSLPLFSPDARQEPEIYLSWLLDTVKSYKPTVLFPMDDDVMDLAAAHRTELAKYCRLVLPPQESYIIARDKGLAVKAAQKAGLACPETYQIEDLTGIGEISSKITYPVLIKPRMSSGSRGMSIVYDSRLFAKAYREVHEKYPFPLIQEYLEQGDRYDVCLLFNQQSRLKAAFVQKEIRHFPPEMGPSTMQESVYAADLLEQAEALLASLNWQGLAEVEFMKDPQDGKMRFMEINPRFWGSLQLAILAGVDFPWLYYQLAVEGDVRDSFTYESGLRCRHFFPGDVLHFITSKNRFKLDPPLFAGKKERVFDDIVSWEDPLPAGGVVLSCFRYLLDKKMWRFMFKR